MTTVKRTTYPSRSSRVYLPDVQICHWVIGARDSESGYPALLRASNGKIEGDDRCRVRLIEIAYFGYCKSKVERQISRFDLHWPLPTGVTIS